MVVGGTVAVHDRESSDQVRLHSIPQIVHPEAHNPSPDPTHRNYSSTFSSVPSHKSMHESPCLLVASDYL